MEQTGILLIAGARSQDLALSLKSVLEEAKPFGFEVTQEALLDELSSFRSRNASANSARGRPNVVVLCLPTIRLEDNQAALGHVRQRLPDVPIVVVTDSGEPKELCEFLDSGACDFIITPIRPCDLIPRLWRLRKEAGTVNPVVAQLKEKLGLKQLVGESSALLAEIRNIPAIAKCDATVLICGETGTGKEMFARAIHHLSPRSAKPFVPVNCGAIPVDLVENELFGHEPGAFTGAHSSADGLLRKTDGGSLFLDEIDCLPLLAQVKLLRFLQEREFRPLGAGKTHCVDVRVIAASNVKLDEAVRKSRFRQDLYFRLNVIGLALPPLRDRKEDIPLLARHFLAKYASAFGAPAKDFTPSALRRLMLHDWPGNVRELENVVERCVVLGSKSVLGAEDIHLPRTIPVGEGESFQVVKAKMIAQFERGCILDLLRNHQGNISKAATAAGKNRRAFWQLMRKYDIHAEPRRAAVLPDGAEGALGRTALS